MYPEIISIGPLTVHSFGLMLGVAFIVSSYVMTKMFEKAGYDSAMVTEIAVIAIISGVAGSKLLHLLENWSDFIADPIGEAFSPGGLTFHGGLILAIIIIAYYIRKKKLSFFRVADLTAPALALGYGIGRIGCHLAGDGDYGIPTDLPWGTNYENGVVPPSHAFYGSEIAAQYPNGIVPNNTPLHPTPMYEFFGAVIIFFILWYFLKKNLKVGQVFGLYLILTSIARFFVEFIRLNPIVLFNLSQAQVISIGLFIAGIIGYIYFGKYGTELPAVEPAKVNKKRNS